MSHTPSPHRLVPENYPQRLQIDTRYGDLDSYAHLNNVAIARFYEDSRARLNMSVFQNEQYFRVDATSKTLLVETRLRYLAEGHYPAPVTVTTGIGRLGSSSFEIHQALFQHGRCIGLCDAVMVYVLNDQPCPIPEEVRRQFKKLMIRTDN